MHYNFRRIHRTIRVTPRMEAGVTDRLWDTRNIVRLLEAAAPKPGVLPTTTPDFSNRAQYPAARGAEAPPG